MIYRVELTPDALDDLARLMVFIADRSLETALRANDLIRSRLASLSAFPYRGRRTAQPDIRELVIPFGRRAYIARYRISADLVIVAGIRHSHEQSREAD